MQKIFGLPIFLFKVVLVILVIAGAVTLWKFVGSHSPFTVNTSGTAVVKEMRELNRLETASFTIEKIIDAKTNGNAFEQLLFGDKILLIANGEVIAGFDFSTIKDEDVKVNGKKVSLNLPAPQILVSRLNNDKTRVYDRQQGLLSQGQKDMETAARQSAEASIRAAACDSGILDQAKDNGRKSLTALLGGLGFQEVEITIATGKCE
jgi:hypothetical protein